MCFYIYLTNIETHVKHFNNIDIPKVLFFSFYFTSYQIISYIASIISFVFLSILIWVHKTFSLESIHQCTLKVLGN